MDPGTEEILERCMPQCRLHQEPGYVIYSAVGSFYAPMLVMMFFNWRIYREVQIRNNNSQLFANKFLRKKFIRYFPTTDFDPLFLGLRERRRRPSDRAGPR